MYAYSLKGWFRTPAHAELPELSLPAQAVGHWGPKVYQNPLMTLVGRVGRGVSTYPITLESGKGASFPDF